MEFFQILEGEEEFQLNCAGNGKFAVRNDECSSGADVCSDRFFVKNPGAGCRLSGNFHLEIKDKTLLLPSFLIIHIV